MGIAIPSIPLGLYLLHVHILSDAVDATHDVVDLQLLGLDSHHLLAGIGHLNICFAIQPASTRMEVQGMAPES